MPGSTHLISSALSEIGTITHLHFIEKEMKSQRDHLPKIIVVRPRFEFWHF
jgi:hypothetical protein